MDPSDRVDLVWTGDPLLMLIGGGLLFLLVLFILEAGTKK